MNGAKTIACLAGAGVGPELMAAASRALGEVARLHSLEIDDIHLPFAGEAYSRSGHALPAATRAAYRQVDAILVAAADEPALQGVKADLQLTWRVARIHFGSGGGVVVFGPLDPSASSLVIARAFSCAASRRGQVTCVGDSADWRDAVDRERARWGGMAVQSLSLGEVLVGLKEQPEQLDVIVTEAQLVTPIVDAAVHFADSHATVAQGWMSNRGPGIFAPGTCDGDEVAGFGVTDPSGMLFTASLLLAEGLKRRSASRTLERAVGAAVRSEQGRETRRFTDAVLELLPATRTDLEHLDEVWQ